MHYSILPKQPHLIISYLKVGRLLYYSLLLFVLEAYIYWVMLDKALAHSSILVIIFWIFCFLFSFSHIFLVMMDGWSRFQNYKRAKDQFFVHGFHKRIANTYIGSKCQRMAAIVAAEELGMGNEIKEYYQKKNVKWYHFIPYFMTKDPLFFLKNKFWTRTFLEKNYKSKFDYNKLQHEIKLQS